MQPRREASATECGCNRSGAGPGHYQERAQLAPPPGARQVPLVARATTDYDVRTASFCPFDPGAFLTAGRDALRAYRLHNRALRGMSIRRSGGAGPLGEATKTGSAAASQGVPGAVASSPRKGASATAAAEAPELPGTAPRGAALGPNIFTAVAWEAGPAAAQAGRRFAFAGSAAGVVFQVDYARCEGAAGRRHSTHIMGPRGAAQHARTGVHAEVHLCIYAYIGIGSSADAPASRPIQHPICVPQALRGGGLPGAWGRHQLAPGGRGHRGHGWRRRVRGAPCGGRCIVCQARTCKRGTPPPPACARAPAAGARGVQAMRVQRSSLGCTCTVSA